MFDERPRLGSRKLFAVRRLERLQDLVDGEGRGLNWKLYAKLIT